MQVRKPQDHWIATRAAAAAHAHAHARARAHAHAAAAAHAAAHAAAGGRRARRGPDGLTRREEQVHVHPVVVQLARLAVVPAQRNTQRNTQRKTRQRVSAECTRIEESGQRGAGTACARGRLERAREKDKGEEN
eukprot:380527-Rhodomonas_salina.3